MNPLLKWLTLRSFRIKREYPSLAFAIAVIGVAVGVSALIIVNAVMTGFQSAIKSRLLSGNADIVVMKRDGAFYNHSYVESKLSKFKHIAGVESFVYVPVMVIGSSSSTAVSASLRGCEPDKEPAVTDIPKKLLLGRWSEFESNENGVVLGRLLAEEVGVTVGDTITVLSPFEVKTPFGLFPKTARFTVSGIFEVGMYQFDSSLILAHMKTVKRKFGFGDAVTGIMVKLTGIEHLDSVKKKIQDFLGDDFMVQDWISLNKNLFSALKLEKLAMFFILTLIVIVASFNISSLLMMNANSKSRDIAILKAMGMKDSVIVKIFLLRGLLIGGLGTLIGEVIGVAVAVAGEKYKLISLPQDVYYIDHLPFLLTPFDCVLIGVTAVLLATMASVYPAKKASKMNIVEVLRREGG